MKAHPREMHDQAHFYYGTGMSTADIAHKMRVSTTTIRRWVDPSAAERCREASRKQKEKYRGACESCGRPTDGSNGPGKASKYCHRCTSDRKRKWTEETVIVAMHAWENQYGEPPTAAEWRTSKMAGGTGWPATRIVQALFGTWNQGIVAAGFKPFPSGIKRNDRVGRSLRGG